MRSIRLKCSEAYANFAKLSTLRNFTVCNSERFESTWLSALNFTSVKVAKLSSQTLRKSSSFRTLRRLHELAKLSTLTTYTSQCEVHTRLRYDLSNAPSVSDVASFSPEFQWSQSCPIIWRTQNSSAARIFPAPNPLPYSKYDTQTTQILLEEYIL